MNLKTEDYGFGLLFGLFLNKIGEKIEHEKL